MIKRQTHWRYIIAAAASALISVYDTVVTAIYSPIMTERAAFQADTFVGTERNPAALCLLDAGSLIECKSAGIIVAFALLVFLSRTKYRVLVYATLVAQVTLFTWLNFSTPQGTAQGQSDALIVLREVAQFYTNHP